MNRKDFVLAVMSSCQNSSFTPVQVQKLFFLIDKLLAEKIGGPYFNFSPYHYGPFDKQLYSDLRELANDGLASVNGNGSNSLAKYALTEEGRNQGLQQLEKMPKHEIRNVTRLSEYVRSMTFSELVASIYKAFPEMKANSIFVE